MKNKKKNQIKAIDDHGKQLAESNELIKMAFNIGRDSKKLEEQKKYLINLLKKDLVNLGI